MDNNKRVLSIRILEDYSMRLKTWAMMGSIHNTISLEYDEHDIVSYAICRYEVINPSFSIDFISAKTSSSNTSISEYPMNTQFNIPENSGSHTVPKNFRLDPNVESKFDSISKNIPGASKTSLFKSILKNVTLNNDEFIRFIIKNYLISVSAGIIPSYSNGRVTYKDLKAFVLYNSGLQSTIKFEKSIISKLIGRIEEISSYKKLIEEIKNSENIDKGRMQQCINDNISKIEKDDYTPYSQFDIQRCLYNFCNLGSSFPTILELFAMYSSLAEWKDALPNAYKIYPRLFKKIIVDGIINAEAGNKEIIDENYKKFTEILFDEAENLKNLIR